MRTMILMLALASVAAPAIAQPDDWAARRAERIEQRQQEQAVEAPPAEQRREEGWAERRAARVDQRQQEQAVEPQRAEQPREDGWAQRRAARVEQRQQEQAVESPRGWQRSEAVQAPQAAQPERGARGAWNRGEDMQRGSIQGPDAAHIARWRERQERRRAEQAREGSVAPTRWSDRIREAPGGGATPPTAQDQTVPVVRHGAHQGEQHWGGNRDGRRWDGNRDGHRWDGTRRRDGQVLEGRTGSGQWQGTQQPARHWDRQRDGQRWSNHWRRDSRYDWQRYRARNRAIFRVGRYYDPFGWGYRPLSIGFRLYSGYYRSNYWLDDPWQYRLPPVYGPYRWVRYYDDAVLVDIWTGEVVDVIRNFFW